jgi:hypothetical protein
LEAAASRGKWDVVRWLVAKEPRFSDSVDQRKCFSFIKFGTIKIFVTSKCIKILWLFSGLLK